MRVLCLLDDEVKQGDHWMWNDLPGHADEVEFLWVRAAGDRFPKWGKLLVYYPTYFWLAARAVARVRRSEFDIVVAWEGKNGIPFALLRSVLRMQRPRFVIMGYNQRGVIGHFPALARFALKSVDRLIVFSKWEGDHLAEALGIPATKVSFCRHGWYDVSAIRDDVAAPTHDFILSSGRSYRDYRTLSRALEGLPIRVVITARPFNLKGIDFPSNVEVHDLVSQVDFWTLMMQSRFVVVPLMKIQHSGGDSVILQAMAAGKAVVATRAPSTETYVADGITGILVPPNDAQALRVAMARLIGDPAEAISMGRAARLRYEKHHTPSAVARSRYEVLQDVCRG